MFLSVKLFFSPEWYIMPNPTTSGQYAHVYLTSRNLELGQKALVDIKATTENSVKYHQLDIACEKSIQTFRDYIEQNYNGFDVLGEFCLFLNLVSFSQIKFSSKCRIRLQKRSD